MGLVRIRKINEDEYDVFAKVCADAFSDKKERFPYRGAFIDKRLLEIDCSIGRQLFGAFDGDEPAGLLEIGTDDDFNCVIYIIAVDKRFRGGSIGSGFIDFSIYKAQNSGMEHVVSKIFSEDLKLRDWFYKRGFFMDSDGNLKISVKEASHGCGHCGFNEK